MSTKSNVRMSVALLEYLKFCGYLSGLAYCADTDVMKQYIATNKLNSSIKADTLTIYTVDSKIAVTVEVTVFHPTYGVINAIAVSFQGSNNLTDAISDASPVSQKDFKNSIGTSVGQASIGFVNYYYKVKEVQSNGKSMIQNITSAANKFRYVIVTGHSLGGAFASLNAVDLYTSNLETNQFKTLLATFGSPRVFDPSSAMNINNFGIEHFRVVNCLDPVTPVPSHFRFHHFGIPIGYSEDVNKWIISPDLDFSGYKITIRVVEIAIDLKYHYLAGPTGYIARIENYITKLPTEKESGCEVGCQLM